MIILAGVVAAALLLYITLSLYVFPQMYQSIEPRRPEAVITNVSLSTPVIRLGQTFVISVTGTNRGEEADMQIVSVGFPNLTRADNMVVLEHNFTQTPILINTSEVIGSEYSGRGTAVTPTTLTCRSGLRQRVGLQFLSSRSPSLTAGMGHTGQRTA